MIRYLWPLLSSRFLSKKEKIDGLLVLFVFTIPLLQILAMADGLALFFLGEMHILAGALAFLFVGTYNTFGNFAPFNQIGTAALLDGADKRILLLPLLLFSFFFNTWNISLGLMEAFVDIFSGRKVSWVKTKRFRKNDGTGPNAKTDIDAITPSVNDR